MASAFILVYHQFLTSFGLLQAQIEQAWHRSFRKVWLLIMASTVSEREISTDASKSRDQEYKIVCLTLTLATTQRPCAKESIRNWTN